MPAGEDYNLWAAYTDGSTDFTATFQDSDGLAAFRFVDGCEYKLTIDASGTYDFIGLKDDVPTVVTPQVSPVAGTYEAPLTVSMTCDTHGATIYYTMDGTDPAANTDRYICSESFEISRSRTITAMAVRSDLATSDLATVELVVTGGDATAPTATLATDDNLCANSAPLMVTLEFSELVSGFDISDLSLSNCTAALTHSEGTSYTLSIAPETDGTTTIRLPADAVVDGNYNPNAESNTLTFEYRAMDLGEVVDIEPTDDAAVCYALDADFQHLLKLDLRCRWIDSAIDLPYANPTAMDYAASTDILYIVYRASSKITRYSLATGEFLAEYSFTPSGAFDIQVGETMGRIVVKHTGPVSLLDIQTGDIKVDAATVGWTFMALADEHQKMIIADMGSGSGMMRYSLSGDTVTLEEMLEYAGVYGRHLALSNDELHLAFSCSGGNALGTGYYLCDFDPYDFTRYGGEWAISGPMCSAFSPDGKYLYTVKDAGLYVETAEYEHIRTLAFPYSDNYVVICPNSDGSAVVGFSYRIAPEMYHRFYFFTDVRE